MSLASCVKPFHSHAALRSYLEHRLYGALKKPFKIYLLCLCAAIAADRVLTFLPTAELHEQNGHPSLGKDGDKKVQGQREGPAREQLRGLGLAEQQLHLRLRHLSGEVHRRGGEERLLI